NDLVIITGGNSSAIGMVTGTANGVPAAGTVTACGALPNIPYVVPANTTARTIQFVSTDLLGMNKTGAQNIIRNVTPLATLSRVKLATYRVLNDGTLVRTEYGNFTPGGKQDMPLAYNVEDMQIKYVLTDGTLLDDPAAGVDGIFGNGDDTPDNMENVRQVRITVTVRSPERDKNGNYHKVTLASTFNTRNIGYDAQ
ncbi:MAG: PilW family protein, partial [Pyrinomonadaceae bacterium]|nr:PilW family protein [Pyrinomonadaceae bacterium]